MAMRREHQDMVRHLRHRIQVAGIKARVRGQVVCGDECIQVNIPTPDGRFTDDEQRAIRHIAQCNRLTWVRGLPIDPEQMTNPQDFNFYMPPPADRPTVDPRPQEGQGVVILRGEWAGEAGTVAVVAGGTLSVRIGRLDRTVNVLTNSVRVD